MIDDEKGRREMKTYTGYQIMCYNRVKKLRIKRGSVYGEGKKAIDRMIAVSSRMCE